MTYIVDHEAPKTSNGDFLPCGKGDFHMPKPSVGIVQISMFYHPQVTPELASNAVWSLEWLASRLREGKCSWWTTCRDYVLKMKEKGTPVRNI